MKKVALILKPFATLFAVVATLMLFSAYAHGTRKASRFDHQVNPMQNAANCTPTPTPEPTPIE